MQTVIEAAYEGGYRLRLRFGNGESHVVDLEAVVHRYPAAAPLRDPARFAEFFIDDWPTLAWPCGFDLSPETLYSLATGRAPVWAEPAEAMSS